MLDPAPTVNPVALTVPQRILMSLHRLESEQKKPAPITANELVVAAWQDSPEQFGLEGFLNQFPDSNRALAAIMGERGLVRRGWIDKVGQKQYRLGAPGREEVECIQQGKISGPDGQKRRLNRIEVPAEVRPTLEKLMSSSVLHRWRSGGPALAFIKGPDVLAFLDLAEQKFMCPLPEGKVTLTVIKAAGRYLVRGVLKFSGEGNGILEITDDQIGSLFACWEWVETDKRFQKIVRERRMAQEASHGKTD